MNFRIDYKQVIRVPHFNGNEVRVRVKTITITIRLSDRAQAIKLAGDIAAHSSDTRLYRGDRLMYSVKW